jgi:hypothetical protein
MAFPSSVAISIPSGRVFLGFLLLALFFNFDFILGPYSLVRHHDAFDTEYINLAARGRLFLENGFFNWYPHFAGGMPSFAERVAPYYLPGILSALFPVWLVYIAWRIAAMTIAGYGMFMLLRRYLGLSHFVALFGGFFFAVVRPVYVHVVFDYAFPLFLVWCMDLVYRDLTLRSKLAILAGILLFLAISYPVTTFPFYPVYHFALVFFLGWKAFRQNRHLVVIFLVWTGFFLFFLPHIIRLFEYTPFAQRDFITPFCPRGYIPMTADGIAEALGSFAFKFYMSALYLNPVALLLLFGFPLLKDSRRLRILAGMLIVPSFLHALFASHLVVLFENTFLIKMDLTHIHFVNIVTNTLLAAVIIEKSIPLSWKVISKRAAAAIAIMIVMRLKPIPLSGIFVDLALVHSAVFLLGLSILACARGSLASLSIPTTGGASSRKLVLCTAGFVLVGMLAKHPQNLVQPFQRLYGNHPELAAIADQAQPKAFRVAGIGTHPAIPLHYGLETAGQRGALFNKYYKEMIGMVIAPQLTTADEKKAFATNWYDLFLETTGYCQSLNKCWNLPLLEMLNVRYLISDKPLKDMDDLASLYARSTGRGLPSSLLAQTSFNRFFTFPLWIYELHHRFERGYFVEEVSISQDRAALLNRMAKAGRQVLRRTVFFMEADLDDDATHPTSVERGDDGAVDSLSLTSYATDRIEWQGNVSRPGYWVVTNNYDPKWVALVNGEPANVYRANHAFQAIPIARTGKVTIVLSYHETAIWQLHVFSAAGFCLIVFTVFGLTRNRRRSFPDGCPAEDSIQKMASQQQDLFCREGRSTLLLVMTTTALLSGLHLLWAFVFLSPLPGWSSQTIRGVQMYIGLIGSGAGFVIGAWTFLACTRAAEKMNPGKRKETSCSTNNG